MGETWFPPWERAAGERRSQNPLALSQDPRPVVDDLQARVEHDAGEVERADVLATGIGVVVVAECEVDGAEPALLRRRAERRPLARPERELADDVGSVNTGDHFTQPVGLGA